MQTSTTISRHSKAALALVLSLLPCWLLAQPLNYAVLLNGKPIGSLAVGRQQEGDTQHYTLRSETDFTVLFTNMQLTYDIEATLRAGILQRATTHQWQKGKLKDETEVLREPPSRYHLRNGKRSETLSHTGIGFCVSMLYHHEPRGLDSLFSERYLQYVAIVPQRDEAADGLSRYELRLPGGRTNTYTYRDGICQEVEVRYTFMITLRFVKQEPAAQKPAAQKP